MAVEQSGAEAPQDDTPPGPDDQPGSAEADLDELNKLLRRQCENERERVVQSKSGHFTIKERFAEELAAAAAGVRAVDSSGQPLEAEMQPAEDQR